MRQLQIASLVLSSFLLLSGCAISKYKRLCCDKIIITTQDVAPVIPASGLVKYKASIDVLKNHLSGLLLVKETDSLTKRLVFVTELGLKMFDFEAQNGTINTVYVFDPLNKPVMIDALKRNFNHMLLLDAYWREAGKCAQKDRKIFELRNNPDKCYLCVADTASRALALQETFHKRKLESRIEYSYDRNTGRYTKIKAKQYGLVKFYFDLELIPPSHD